MCVAPTCPFDSSACAIVIPMVFTWRDMSPGTRGAIGSAKGGSQIRVGNGAVWCCT